MKPLPRRPLLSPSMVVAFLALVIALGGTSYAVTKLPARSVGTKELKPNAVTRTAIRNNAVNGAKVAKDALTGDDINESRLARVPLALTADRVTGAVDRAAAAGRLDTVFYRVVAGSVGAATGVAPNIDPTPAVATATCDAGHFVVGGGAKVDDPGNMQIIDSFPSGAGAWTANVTNDDVASGHGFNVYAICVPAGAAG